MGTDVKLQAKIEDIQAWALVKFFATCEPILSQTNKIKWL